MKAAKGGWLQRKAAEGGRFQRKAAERCWLLCNEALKSTAQSVRQGSR